MSETITKDRGSIYEASYLIVSSVPEEKVPGEAEALKTIVLEAGATMIAEENPHLETLAYEMRRKSVSGSYETYGKAYFGWMKFEVGSDKIEALKNALEAHPSVLRVLVISTVRENTYLGKRATMIAASFGAKSESAISRVEDKEARKETKKETAPVSVEEMDKSIDEMVKEA